MSLSLNPRIFRMAICVFAILFAGETAIKDLRDYRRAGTHPAPITIAEANSASQASPFIRRWIQLKDPLQLDCQQVLQDDGASDDDPATLIMAFDADRQHAFLLQFKGRIDCDQAGSRQLSGMLVQPAAKFWTTHGMSLPEPPFPLMQIDVGLDPTSLLKEAQVLAAVVFICGALLWYLLISSRRRPIRPIMTKENAFAEAARVP